MRSARREKKPRLIAHRLGQRQTKVEASWGQFRPKGRGEAQENKAWKLAAAESRRAFAESFGCGRADARKRLGKK